MIDTLHINRDSDTILPPLNVDTLQRLDLSDKPVLLKRSIIVKNVQRHHDVSYDDMAEILSTALYIPEVILKADANKPYLNLICRIGQNKNSIVCLDVDSNKPNLEVVNMHYLDNEARERKFKIDERIRNK